MSSDGAPAGSKPGSTRRVNTNPSFSELIQPGRGFGGPNEKSKNRKKGMPQWARSGSVRQVQTTNVAGSKPRRHSLCASAPPLKEDEDFPEIAWEEQSTNSSKSPKSNSSSAKQDRRLLKRLARKIHDARPSLTVQDDRIVEDTSKPPKPVPMSFHASLTFEGVAVDAKDEEDSIQLEDAETKPRGKGRDAAAANGNSTTSTTLEEDFPSSSHGSSGSLGLEEVFPSATLRDSSSSNKKQPSSKRLTRQGESSRRLRRSSGGENTQSSRRIRRESGGTDSRTLRGESEDAESSRRLREPDSSSRRRSNGAETAESKHHLRSSGTGGDATSSRGLRRSSGGADNESSRRLRRSSGPMQAEQMNGGDTAGTSSSRRVRRSSGPMESKRLTGDDTADTSSSRRVRRSSGPMEADRVKGGDTADASSSRRVRRSSGPMEAERVKGGDTADASSSRRVRRSSGPMEADRVKGGDAADASSSRRVRRSSGPMEAERLRRSQGTSATAEAEQSSGSQAISKKASTRRLRGKSREPIEPEQPVTGENRALDAIRRKSSKLLAQTSNSGDGLEEQPSTQPKRASGGSGQREPKPTPAAPPSGESRALQAIQRAQREKSVSKKKESHPPISDDSSDQTEPEPPQALSGEMRALLAIQQAQKKKAKTRRRKKKDPESSLSDSMSSGLDISDGSDEPFDRHAAETELARLDGELLGHRSPEPKSSARRPSDDRGIHGTDERRRPKRRSGADTDGSQRTGSSRHRGRSSSSQRSGQETGETRRLRSSSRRRARSSSSQRSGEESTSRRRSSGFSSPHGSDGRRQKRKSGKPGMEVKGASSLDASRTRRQSRRDTGQQSESGRSLRRGSGTSDMDDADRQEYRKRRSGAHTLPDSEFSDSRRRSERGSTRSPSRRSKRRSGTHGRPSDSSDMESSENFHRRRSARGSTRSPSRRSKRHSGAHTVHGDGVAQSDSVSFARRHSGDGDTSFRRRNSRRGSGVSLRESESSELNVSQKSLGSAGRDQSNSSNLDASFRSVGNFKTKTTAFNASHRRNSLRSLNYDAWLDTEGDAEGDHLTDAMKALRIHQLRRLSNDQGETTDPVQRTFEATSGATGVLGTPKVRPQLTKFGGSLRSMGTGSNHAIEGGGWSEAPSKGGPAKPQLGIQPLGSSKVVEQATASTPSRKPGQLTMFLKVGSQRNLSDDRSLATWQEGSSSSKQGTGMFRTSGSKSVAGDRLSAHSRRDSLDMDDEKSAFSLKDHPLFKGSPATPSQRKGGQLSMFLKVGGSQSNLRDDRSLATWQEGRKTSSSRTKTSPSASNQYQKHARRHSLAAAPALQDSDVDAAFSLDNHPFFKGATQGAQATQRTPETPSRRTKQLTMFAKLGGSLRSLADDQSVLSLSETGKTPGRRRRLRGSATSSNHSSGDDSSSVDLDGSLRSVQLPTAHLSSLLAPPPPPVMDDESPFSVENHPTFQSDAAPSMPWKSDNTDPSVKERPTLATVKYYRRHSMQFGAPSSPLDKPEGGLSNGVQTEGSVFCKTASTRRLVWDSKGSFNSEADQSFATWQDATVNPTGTGERRLSASTVDAGADRRPSLSRVNGRRQGSVRRHMVSHRDARLERERREMQLDDFVAIRVGQQPEAPPADGRVRGSRYLRRASMG